MKNIELLAIGLRLVGIYTLLLGAKTTALLLQAIPSYKSAWDGEVPTFIFLIALTEILVILSAGILLLKFPISISKLLLPKTTELEPILSGEAKDIQTAIFCVIGVYILSWAIPDLINNLLFLYGESRVTGSINQSQYFILTIVTVIELSIGGYLSLQAKGLSNLLWKLRGYKE